MTLNPPAMLQQGGWVSPIQVHHREGMMAAPDVREQRLGASLALPGTLARL
jgi:hypothetical protein